MTEDCLKEICLCLFGGTYEDVAKKVLKAYWNGELNEHIIQRNKEGR